MPNCMLLRRLRDPLTDLAFDARTFGAVARDIGFLDVTVAAHDLRQLGQRDQPRQIDLAVEMAEDHGGVFARQRPLHPALGGVAEDVERSTAQALQLREYAERLEDPRTEFALL